jgi:hypothetical protein
MLNIKYKSEDRPIESIEYESHRGYKLIIKQDEPNKPSILFKVKEDGFAARVYLEDVEELVEAILKFAKQINK